MIFFGGFLEEDWKPPVEPVGFLKWLVLFFIFLWFVWFFTGGPERYESRQAPFLKPPSPIDTGEQYGTEELPISLPMFEVIAPNINIFWEKLEYESFSFDAPKSWNKEQPRLYNNCLGLGLANDTSDGHRMAGEIGIYEASCFNLNSASGRKQFVLKDGFFIVSYYDENDTTPDEIKETKAVFERIEKTFVSKKN